MRTREIDRMMRTIGHWMDSGFKDEALEAFKSLSIAVHEKRRVMVDVGKKKVVFIDRA